MPFLSLSAGCTNFTLLLTSTKVQILTPEELSSLTSTKVQILTPEELSWLGLLRLLLGAQERRNARQQALALLALLALLAQEYLARQGVSHLFTFGRGFSNAEKLGGRPERGILCVGRQR